MRKRQIYALLTFVAVCLALAVAPAGAADTRGGDQVRITPDEVIAGDLYVTAQRLTVDGTIKGDLIVGASQVVINGTVEGDVLALAQAVVVNGTVGDDLRAMAQAIMLGPNARVGGDMAVGAASLENQAGSHVRGDILVGAFQGLLAGEVGQNVRGGLSRLELRGAVGGDVDVTVDGSDTGPSPMLFSPPQQVAVPSVAPGLTLADTARIGGKLSYTSATQAKAAPSAKVGGAIAFNQAQATQPAQAPQLPGLAILQRLAALLLVGALLVLLVPAWLGRLSDVVERRPLPSLGWGLLALGAFIAVLIGVLVATIALAMLFGFLTLGGLAAMIVSLGLLLNGALIVGYIAFAAYIAEAAIALAAGRWLLRRMQPNWAEQPLIPLALGLLLYVLLRAVPVLGGVLALVVMLLGMGALWQWGRALIQRGRPSVPPLAGLQPV